MFPYGCHDPQIFLEWTLQVDKYVTWHNLTELRKIGQLREHTSIPTSTVD